MKHFFDRLGTDYMHVSETVSTNTDARRLAENGLSRPLVVLADKQTGGRGRTGKVFHSPEGGLYMTLALPWGLPLTDTVGVTACASLAAAWAIESLAGAVCGIKWVNDLYLDGGKLCGILTESLNDYRSMTSEVLLIGVGVNLTTAPVISDSAVPSVSLAELGYPCSRDALCREITKNLLEMAKKHFDLSLYIGEYTRRSTVLGKEIFFTHDNVTRAGRAISIRRDGALIIACGEETVALESGEIHLRINETKK